MPRFIIETQDEITVRMRPLPQGQEWGNWIDLTDLEAALLQEAEEACNKYQTRLDELAIMAMEQRNLREKPETATGAAESQ